MLEEDQFDYETNLSASRNTGSLFKYYRTFATTQVPTSIHLKDEFATDPLSQAKLLSKFIASNFIESSDVTPKYFSSPDFREIKATGPDRIPPIVFKNCA